MEILTPIIIIVGFGVLIFLQFIKSRSPDESAEFAVLKKQLADEKSEKDELIGKGKALQKNYIQMEAKFDSALKENEKLNKEISKHEAKKEQMEKEHSKEIADLSETRRTLEKEQQRVLREDEERQQKEEEERDRMWGEHENNVVTFLKGLCRQPQYGFPVFDNNDLPSDFDGSLKPDLMIEFLDQYIIFDAKVTRSQSIQTYITKAVKDTAKKIKGNPKIYSSVFLVVPTEAISELKQMTYVEQGINFFIVSPESLEPILASLKKITMYELADQFDPKEREEIVNWIAKLDFHINARSTFDLMLAEISADILTDAERQNPKLAKEVEQRKEKMSTPRINPSEMKRLVSSIVAREEKIAELSSPKPKVAKKDTGFLGTLLGEGKK